MQTQREWRKIFGDHLLTSVLAVLILGLLRFSPAYCEDCGQSEPTQLQP
jgi:hypothetical protein